MRGITRLTFHLLMSRKIHQNRMNRGITVFKITPNKHAITILLTMYFNSHVWAATMILFVRLLASRVSSQKST